MARPEPGANMRRREFIAAVGGALAMPLAARAQSVPVIGFLNTSSPDGYAERLRSFRQGLKETGYVDSENVTIEYRWAENQIDRLPELAAELVRKRASVIVTSGGIPAHFVAKAATTTTPIVFLTAQDPVKLGLVASLARPGGNLTGFSLFTGELAAKQLDLLRALVPAATRVAVLVNPANAANAETMLRDLQAAARTMGLQIEVHNASTNREIDAVFATFVRERPDAVFIGTDAFLSARRVQLALLAAHYRIPAIYSGRENAEAGGLMSYGSDIANAFRNMGVYAGRILGGNKPADMPVVQASKLELVINAQTARMLGLTVPQTLLAAADEIID